MPYIDALTMLSGTVNPATNAMSGQALSGSSPVLSTNAMDLGASHDLRASTFQFQVTQAFAGPATVEMQLIGADDAATSVNVVPMATTGPIPLAQLVQGARFIAEMNADLNRNGRRFIAARYVPVGGAISAGAVICSAVADISDTNKPSIFNTSYTVV